MALPKKAEHDYTYEEVKETKKREKKRVQSKNSHPEEQEEIEYLTKSEVNRIAWKQVTKKSVRVLMRRERAQVVGDPVHGCVVSGLRGSHNAPKAVRKKGSYKHTDNLSHLYRNTCSTKADDSLSHIL
eukprot:TRINITY_DN79_c0_g1_i7.p1 TRINITY_DN79_c0_g1~~TRINITY_DN79_c0_g1_i7.p1  ORF type:complete len:128 (+),score=37.56 TRINITY_DN79_c0_g1_i7:198-581(+)